MRFSRTNATVSKVHTLFNCCILRKKILYVGLDVHKDTYALCCFDFQRNELSDEMTVKATTKAVIKYLEALKKKHKEEILFVSMKQARPVMDFVVGYRKQSLHAL